METALGPTRACALLRVLQASSSLEAPGDDDLLEFRHLSLMEALVAHALEGAPTDDASTALCIEVLTHKRRANVTHLGGARLGGSRVMRAVLGGLQELPGDRDEAGELVYDPEKCVDRGWGRSKQQCFWRAVVACEALPQLTQLTRLHLRDCHVGGAWYP
jgi:hypothetical protein